MSAVPEAGLTRAAGTAAWRQIELALTADVERGLFPPGSKLPSEGALASRFAVSKATVRRAIAEMSAKQLLVVRNGLGAFVGRTTTRYPLDPHHFWENLSRAGHVPGLEVLEGCQREADVRVAQGLGCRPGDPVTFMLLLGTMDGKPMFIADHNLPGDRFSDLPDKYRITPSFRAIFGTYGFEVRRRSLVIKARPATSEDRRHLGLELGATVIEVETTFVSDRDVVVDLGIARYPADAIELALSLE